MPTHRRTRAAVRRSALAVPGLLTGLLGIAGCGGGEPARPSLLLVTLDTTRRDHLGFHGRTPSPSPNLDALAARSVVFEDAYTVAPLTLPAHASVMTGLHPRSHGVHVNATDRLPDAAVTLAEVLQEQGHATAALVASYVLDPDFGLAQGFDRYDAPPRRGAGSERGFFTERPAEVMVPRALEVLEDLEPPFFLWLHLYDPHYPYAAEGRSTGDRTRDYEQEIRHADAWIGRLLEGVREHVGDESLVVAFASDHGEGLDDTLERNHGHFVFDPTMRVPFLIRAPGLAPRRVQTSVSLADLMPTVLGLLGVPLPPDQVDGRDLGDWMRGQEPATSRAVSMEAHSVWRHYGWAPFEAVVQGPWKLVRSHEVALYDRAEDPREEVNRFDPKDPRSQALLEECVRTFEEVPRSLAADRQALTEGDRQQLAALGYLGGDETGGAERPDFAALPDARTKVHVLDQVEQALELLLSGRDEECLDAFRELVAAEPSSPVLRERLGLLLLHVRPDLLDEAEAQLRECVSLQFERPVAHLGIGLVFNRRAEQEWSRARDLLAAGRRPEATAAESREQELLRVALEQYRLALRFEPHLPDALWGVASIAWHAADGWARAGNRARAAQRMEEAIDHLGKWLAVVSEDEPGRAERQAQWEEWKRFREELSR